MEMEKKKHGKEIAVKTDGGGFAVLSQHTLDLKRIKTGEALKKSPDFYVQKPAPSSFLPLLRRGRSGGEGSVFGDLLLVGVLKTLLFLPKIAIRHLFNLIKSCAGILVSHKDRAYNSLRRKSKEITSIKPIVLNFAPPQHWRGGIAAFVLIAFVFVLPIKAFSSFEELLQQKDDIMEQSFNGYEQLKNSDFTSAGISFASAKTTIDNLGFVFNGLLSIIPGIGGKFSFGNGLLIFGENFSNSAKILQEAISYFDKKDATVVDKVRNLKVKVKEAMPNLLIANSVLKSLDDAYGILPVDINPLKKALNDSVRALLVFQDFADTLLDILGDKQFKRYLFVFQNNNEIRPTGGFLGSFALIDIDRGEIKNIEIPGGGSYDIQGQLRELVISPEPFHLIKSAWQFQDSNWFPDFPESAKKMMWFYEKSGGSSVDGVIAVNASLMEELLKLIGPIEMPEYDRTMSAENFVEETQKIVEIEYDKTVNKPKQIIADMTPKVLDKLFKIEAKDLTKFSELIHKSILAKDILVYLKDTEMENNLESFGLSGKLKDISNFTDYLMLVDTNIAGQKTDGKIIKEIKHSSEIQENGSIINTVEITRRHTGLKGTLFSGVRNVNYLRLYVPIGSKLISAEGFEAPSGELFKSVGDGYVMDEDLMRVQGTVYVEPKTGTRVNNEFGRTVFGNWIMVDPGQEVTVSFKYELPYKLQAEESEGLVTATAERFGLENSFIGYKMLIEKQPGAKNTTFRSYVTAKNKKAVARVGAGVALQNDGWQYETILNSDEYYGVVIE
ncbi:DUF4012 domain-containing protein [Patescibacteria group bacterium]|nr:DUF4012 domain-containing protein [Patescibacteria group bacterium]